MPFVSIRSNCVVVVAPLGYTFNITINNSTNGKYSSATTTFRCHILVRRKKKRAISR